MKLAKCLLALYCLAAVGCGAGGTSSTGVSKGDYESLRTTSAIYGMYMTEHGGKTPPDEQAFRTFVSGKQDILDKVGKTAEAVLSSPRSGEPFVFVVGKRPPVNRQTGMAYVAYEKTPVEGSRLVVAMRGIYELMDEAKFKQIFPQ